MDKNELIKITNICNMGKDLNDKICRLYRFRKIKDHWAGMGFKISCYPTFCSSRGDEFKEDIDIDRDILDKYMDIILTEQLERNEKQFLELKVI